MKALTIGVALAAMSLTAVPMASAAAQGRPDIREGKREVREEKRDLRQAKRFGSQRDVREERRDVRQAKQQVREDRRDWQRGKNYNWNRPDPQFGGYYPENYYREGGNNYRPIALGSNDRIYRGRDDRFYCRRNDGTTGLIVGALGGGVLGNVIAPGGSKTLGSVLGGGLGAVLGRAVERSNIVCR
ncbi:Ni/Co efflux regulator RcnB [Polymorphobacter multimanifer]|uniref:Ni/Co efflux regulator RcnB n=2 Tax=Polymorphobacter multimanifer TaxID=1070431 RepID=A0A841L347_9SPHN|nr:hypothetical protein [Polymorphobacter multimanifer]MBB6225851.1 Ni/Co efflux regulator RcnB [Polymorphobacter multimanifer]